MVTSNLELDSRDKLTYYHVWQEELNDSKIWNSYGDISIACKYFMGFGNLCLRNYLMQSINI